MKDVGSTITVREAAQHLGLSVGHVHRLIDAGSLAVVYRLPGPTGAKLLDRESVEAYASRRERAS